MINIDQGKTLPLASQNMRIWMWMYWSNKHAWINKDFSISYLFMKEVHYFWMNPILTVEDIVYTYWWWQHHVLTPGAVDPESGANKCHRILHEYQDSLSPVVYKSVPGAMCPQFWVQNTGPMMLLTLLVCAVGVSLTTGRSDMVLLDLLGLFHFLH